MIALDTNVLARFFVNDPEDAEAVRQRPVAIAAMSERGLVGVTVLLEFEWLLRGFYKLPREEIARVLRALAGMQHIVIEDRAIFLDAVEAFEAGMDFADALHLLRSSRATAFRTFDRGLAKRAERLGLRTKVEALI